MVQSSEDIPHETVPGKCYVLASSAKALALPLHRFAATYLSID